MKYLITSFMLFAQLAFIQSGITEQLADTNSSIAKMFLKAKENSYQVNASEKTVEAMLDFCADSVIYDHILSPEKKFGFSGKEIWRKGSVSHLGETRNAKIKVVDLIERQNMVIVEFTLDREINTDQKWVADKRNTIVSVIEFDKDKKIKKMTDYL